MKPGTIFEHKNWLDYKNMPLLCRVTAVRDGIVYWAQYGSSSKRRYTFDLSEAGKYVGQVITPEGAGG
jgi:hypothetical protein